MTNCKNCGAPLTASKCSYCGTDYSVSYRQIPNTDRGEYITVPNPETGGLMKIKRAALLAYVCLAPAAIFLTLRK